MTRNWIAVASAEHALHSPSAWGFMQVCHGKRAPLGRVQAGDRIAYYAPARTMGGRDGLQSLVSMGTVLPGEPYAFDMGGGFVPYRRDVRSDRIAQIEMLEPGFRDEPGKTLADYLRSVRKPKPEPQPGLG